MLTYDPRSISSKVYQSLNELKQQTPNRTEQKKQKGQAVELYTYLATWGLLRLRAEEYALDNELQKKRVVQQFFQVLDAVAQPEGDLSLDWLSGETLSTSEYLGLTGVGLQVAREFSFWAEAVYFDVNQNEIST